LVGLFRGVTHAGGLASPSPMGDGRRELSSVQNGLRGFFKLHGPHFDVELRELIFELQASSERIDKAAMPRLRPAVDLKHKVFVVQTVSRYSVLHGTLHRCLRTPSMKRCSQASPVSKYLLMVCRKLVVGGSSA
jgi:hypothetical protein